MNICFLVLLNIILLILLLNKKKILYGGEPTIEEQEKNLIEAMKEKEDIKNKFNLANSERNMLKTRIEVLEATNKAHMDLKKKKIEQKNLRKNEISEKKVKLAKLYEYSDILNSPYKEAIEKVSNLKLWCKDYFDKLVNSPDKSLINDVINVCNILK